MQRPPPLMISGATAFGRRSAMIGNMRPPPSQVVMAICVITIGAKCATASEKLACTMRMSNRK